MNIAPPTVYWVGQCDRMDDADRIESAHKRELSKNVSKNGADFGQLGGAAKLREALITIRDKAYEQYVNDYGIDTVWIQDVANAALAAPARNCDRFANAVEAMAELKRIHSRCADENRRCLEGCPDCGKEWCSLAWLFATAEGGNDGNE